MRRIHNPRKYNKDHIFFCTICGNVGLPVCRIKGKNKELGHLKKLFCLNCGKETNHAECVSGTGYDNAMFTEEYASGNFDENGNRRLEFSAWKQLSSEEGDE